MAQLKFFVLVPLLALLSTGCATRYQDLLADRDNEIRQLRGQLAQSRDDKSRLESEVSRLRNGVPREASAQRDDDLDDIASRLGGNTTVRRDGDGNVAITLDNTVSFDSGSAQLKKSANADLRKIADLLTTTYAGYRIFVEGHTDDQPLNRTKGTWRDNRHLSMERADAVVRWLIDNGGVPERSLAVTGFGPFKPAVQGSSDAARAANRRVELVARPMRD